jgi:hypothetical protein
MFQVLGTYLTIIEFVLLVLSPVVIAALISGFHAFSNWRRADQPVRSIIARRMAATAA